MLAAPTETLPAVALKVQVEALLAYGLPGNWDVAQLPPAGMLGAVLVLRTSPGLEPPACTIPACSKAANKAVKPQIDLLKMSAMDQWFFREKRIIKINIIC